MASLANRPRWQRRLTYGTFAVLGVFVLIQFIPYGHNHTNPPVTQEPKWDSPATRALAVTRVLRLPQQPDQMALVLERRPRLLADPT